MSHPAVAAANDAAASFTPERITSEGAAMGTHLAFTAYTTPLVDATRGRKLFGDAKNNLHVSQRLYGKLRVTAVPTDAP
jgi:hypothetical protein